MYKITLNLTDDILEIEWKFITLKKYQIYSLKVFIQIEDLDFPVNV